MPEAFTQLVEVRVDLTRAIGREGHQAELRVDAVKQTLNVGMNHGVVLT